MSASPPTRSVVFLASGSCPRITVSGETRLRRTSDLSARVCFEEKVAVCDSIIQLRVLPGGKWKRLASRLTAWRVELECPALRAKRMAWGREPRAQVRRTPSPKWPEGYYPRSGQQ